jgi:hypothetical protein
MVALMTVVIVALALLGSDLSTSFSTATGSV